MRCILLQDWVTVRPTVPGAAAAVTQSSDKWLDATPYQDVVAWIQCADCSTSAGTLTLGLLTSPTRDIALQQAIGAVDGTIAAVTVNKSLNAAGAVPVARWVYWSVSSTVSATWDVTFRIFLAVNSPGGN